MIKSIKAQLVIVFSVLSFLGLGMLVLIELYGIPLTDLKGHQKTEAAEIFNNLNLIADLKKERLERWLEERRDDARVVSGSMLVKSNMRLLRPRINDLLSRRVTEPGLWSSITREESYKNLEEFFKLVIESYGVYQRICIADAQTGVVVVSSQKGDLGGVIGEKNEIEKPLDFDVPYISDIRLDAESGKPILQVIRAIEISDSGSKQNRNQEVSAILIMTVFIDDFIKPLLHTGGGLGVTGEALLVSRDVRILTHLKFPLKDGSHAEPLEYIIEAKPAVFAARGEEGIIETVDYRGTRVLAAYRHIAVSPDVGWGMVVKRDYEEIFGAMRQRLQYTFLVSVIILILLLASILILASRIVRPIRTLVRATDAVAAGELRVKVPDAESDELMSLSRSFNHMVDRLAERTKELQDAQEELIRKEKLALLGQLAGSVGHELRNPLGVISNSIYYLKTTLTDAGKTTREHLEMISSEIYNSEKIVSELLDFARIRPLEREEIIVSDLVSQVLDKLAPQEKVEVTVEIASNLPSIFVDPRQMYHVLDNLILNAYQSMEDGGNLTIEAKFVNNEIYLSVTDTGYGIPKEYMKKLFEPLFTTKARGIGLGLALSKNLLEANGGRLEVESEEGKGSTFTIVLPTSEAER